MKCFQNRQGNQLLGLKSPKNAQPVEKIIANQVKSGKLLGGTGKIPFIVNGFLLHEKSVSLSR